MATRLELQAKNNPTTLPRFKFELDSGLYYQISLNLLDESEFIPGGSGFDISGIGFSYYFWFNTAPGMTNESIYESLYMFIPPSYDPIIPMSTPYFDVVFEDGMTTIKFKVHGTWSINPHFSPQAIQQIAENDIAAIVLKFAPDGWEQDEYAMERDMESFGVFRKFTIKELKFVKDGRDYLESVYNRAGVNGNTAFTVTEHTPSGVTRNRFIGKIDFSTYKITKLSVDVEVIDGAFTDLLLTRSKINVNILSNKSIDNEAVSEIPIFLIYSPEVLIYKYSAFTKKEGTQTGSHVIPLLLGFTTFTESETPVNIVDSDAGAFFKNAVSDYAASNITVSFSINLPLGVVKGFKIQLLRYHGGVMTETINEDSYIFSTFDRVLNYTQGIDFDISLGDYLVLQLKEKAPFGYDYRYSNIGLTIKHTSAAQEERIVYGVSYFNALKGLVQQYTGTDRVKSDFLSKYPAIPDGLQEGVFTQKRWLIRPEEPIRDLVTSLKTAMKALQTYNLGLGVEEIDGKDTAVIEPMEHFFNDKVILNLSNRISPKLIEKSVYADILANRIEMGFDSNDLNTSAAVFEPNSRSSWSTVIKPVDKQMSVVSPIRADTAGILKEYDNTAPENDASTQGDIYMVDTVRKEDLGIWYKYFRTNEGFDLVGGGTGNFFLFNLDLTPARTLRRWGSYIRGFNRYLGSLIKYQKSEKGSDLVTQKTGETEPVIEKADVLVSQLSNPRWKPEVVKFEVPAYENDIELIKANPYGLIQASEDIWGWILKYRSKNKKKKSEFTLLVCDTDYVTPNGNPVYPAIIAIKKTIIDNYEDGSKFLVNITGDNGVRYTNLVLIQGIGINLTNVAYGTYTIEEVGIPDGYSLVSIIPNEFTIDGDHLRIDVEVTNAKDIPGVEALELTYDDIANVPVADASDVVGWNAFFDLPTNGTPFTSVEVVGNLVKLRGGSGITLTYGLFTQYPQTVGPYIGDFILQVNDYANSITTNNSGFATSLGWGVSDCCRFITDINLPACTYFSDDSFHWERIEKIKLNSCLNLGSTTNDDGTFSGIIGKNIELTLPSALMTCNGGSPDGDIQTLQANNTVTIITV